MVKWSMWARNLSSGLLNVRVSSLPPTLKQPLLSRVLLVYSFFGIFRDHFLSSSPNDCSAESA